MNRTPSEEIQRQLRREVGFGCPVQGCGCPYLYWHHFDPPWSEKQHHNPDGMIALCGEHHAKADAGAFTKEQLHQFKLVGRNSTTELHGRLDWMRHDLLAVIGGNFYYETPVIFQFRETPIIWFNRDENHYLLLNIHMLTTSQQPRIRIQDNFWIEKGNPKDMKCPPSGKLLYVMYENGDMLQIEFLELDSAAATQARYEDAHVDLWQVHFPLTAMEAQMKIAGTALEFDARETTLPRMNVIRNCFMTRCGVGLRLD